MSLQNVLDEFKITANNEPQTQPYIFTHTMIRVKDLKKSVDFYHRVLGFIPVTYDVHSEGQFTLVYLINKPISEIPSDDTKRKEWVLQQTGVLELTFNHGTENDPNFHYHNGNSEPRGYGHICITVPDVIKACERFENLKVPFQKRLSDGSMKEIAFIKDPDDYWIEILQPTPLNNQP